MGWHVVALPRVLISGAIRLCSTSPIAGRAVTETLRQVFLSGTSVIAPLFVTVVVLGVVFDFVANLLTPFADALTLLGLTAGRDGLVAQGLTLALLLAVVFLTGVVAESGTTTGIGRRFGRLVEAVPGVGSLYSSFHRMSDAMLDGNGRSFREVKLVEFPHAGVYSLAFQTAEISDHAVVNEAGETMLVLFVPLAPNPVMGGFMVCVPVDRVWDIDLSVNEAFQAIVTSGVAMTQGLRPPSN